MPLGRLTPGGAWDQPLFRAPDSRLAGTASGTVKMRRHRGTEPPAESRRPAGRARLAIGSSPLGGGKNVLITSVDGLVPGTTAPTDRMVFDVLP